MLRCLEEFLKEGWRMIYERLVSQRRKANSHRPILERAIRFAEECYIEGIIPIEKVKQIAEFYLVEESKRRIDWPKAAKMVESQLESNTSAKRGKSHN